jgi:hypothetical protein
MRLADKVRYGCALWLILLNRGHRWRHLTHRDGETDQKMNAPRLRTRICTKSVKLGFAGKNFSGERRKRALHGLLHVGSCHQGCEHTP